MDVTTKESIASSETPTQSPVLTSAPKSLFQRFRSAYYAAAAGVLFAMAPNARADEPVQPPSAAAAVKTEGSLVIAGGGVLPKEIHERFVELAGGKEARLVIIPTAHPKAGEDDNWSYWKGPKDVVSVDFLHTRDGAIANDPAFVQPLKKATGAWFAGGWQSNLEIYKGTPLETELKELYFKRGGVVGGTSAGASMLSEDAIIDGDPDVILRKGFGLFPDAIVDQHFLRRQREQRLFNVVSSRPKRFGMGVDERTAAVVRGRIIEVLGEEGVHICLPTHRTPAEMRPFKAGQKIDLDEILRDMETTGVGVR